MPGNTNAQCWTHLEAFILGWTALMHAVKRSHVDVVGLLLKHSLLEVSMRNKNGFSALMDAAKDGKAEMVRMLLDCGADVNQLDINGSQISVSSARAVCA